MIHRTCICPVCSASFVPHNGFQKYCCRACFSAARKAYMAEFNRRPDQQERNRARSRVAYATAEGKARHRVTGRLWDARNRDKVRAIKRRYKESAKGMASDLRYKSSAAYQAARQRKDARRRWRRHNNGVLPADAGIHWTKVAERQGSLVCAVCGRECVPRSRDAGLRPTVDHVIPLVAGGTHTWDNVRLLCMRCNSAKTKHDVAQARIRQEAAA